MQDDLTAFSSEVCVPSKGKFTPDIIPEGKVRLRPIGVQEEKYLLSSNGSRLALADKVLTKCIVLPAGLNLDDVLMTDKFFLLLCLRNLSYGPEYTFPVTCSCKYAFPHTVTLPDGLSIITPDDSFVEPFFADLPVVGKRVGLRYLRGRDEAAIEAYVAQLKPAQLDDGEPSYLYRLACHLVSVDGAAIDILEAMNFCGKLVGRDSLALRKAVQSHQTGASLMIKAQCPKCRKELVAPIQFTSDFFPVAIS